MENWKSMKYRDIFDHIYEVSDKGNIRKVDTKKVLKSHIRTGYKAVCLYNPETEKKSTTSIHRIVACTFLENPENKKTVNHKNGDKLDNTVENLEWATYKENTQHAIETKLQTGHPKRVIQYSLEGEYIQTFDSIIEASEKTGINSRRISGICKGEKPSKNNFIWKHEKDEKLQDDCVGKIIKDFPKYKITKDGKVFSIRARKFLVQTKTGMLKLCNNGIYKDACVRTLVREYYPSVPS
jgi:hypothetical protein